MKGVTSTKASAGRIWAKVSDACDANTLSSPAICGGADCGGYTSAITRRSTTATEITMQIQNPMRNQSGEDRLRCAISVKKRAQQQGECDPAVLLRRPTA